MSRHISKCVICCKIRSHTQGQKMADLPTNRLKPSPPFTYPAVDFFGPFFVKEGRKELRKYGVLFTCMVSRAVHLETANSMDTSSFLNAYHRFVGRRGPVRQLRCDQGTNFVEAKAELEKYWTNNTRQQISTFFLLQTRDLLIPTKLMMLISDLISKYLYHVQIFCKRQPLFFIFLLTRLAVQAIFPCEVLFRHT